VSGWLTNRAAAATAARTVRAVAVDGKTARSSRTLERAPRHVFAAFDHASGMVLGQSEVGDETNEITAFAPLLGPHRHHRDDQHRGRPAHPRPPRQLPAGTQRPPRVHRQEQPPDAARQLAGCPGATSPPQTSPTTKARAGRVTRLNLVYLSSSLRNACSRAATAHAQGPWPGSGCRLRRVRETA
jgi:hypothetical protein